MLRRFCMLFILVLLIGAGLPGAIPALAKSKVDVKETGRFVRQKQEDVVVGCDDNSIEITKYTGGTDRDLVLPEESRSVKIEGLVYLPANYANRKSPILFFLHGTGEKTEEDSEKGFNYLACPLAQAGFIVVSIEADDFNHADGVYGDYIFNMPTGDPWGLLTRGRLVVRHLELWSRWNAGVIDPDISLPTGISVQNLVDLKQVGFLGHSRGGEGVRAAYNYLQDALPNYKWDKNKFGDVPIIQAIFEIGPTDELSRTSEGMAAGYAPLDAYGVVWNVLLPMCDGDQATLQGIRPFDRMLRNPSANDTTQKSGYIVWGANHNYYNSAWNINDGVCIGEDNQLPGNTAEEVQASQRETGLLSVTEFFIANVGASRDRSRNKLFNPLEPLPAGIPTRIQRLLNLPPTTILENFSDPGENDEPDGEHDPVQTAKVVEWSLAAEPFQVDWAANMTPAIGGYGTLELRLARKDDLKNRPDEPTNFSMCLVYGDQDECSQSVRLATYEPLLGPVGGGLAGSSGDKHAILQTVRIPLARFCVSDLSTVHGLRFNFDADSEGAIYVADIGMSDNVGELSNETRRNIFYTCLPAPGEGAYNSTTRTLSWSGVDEANVYDVYLWRVGDETPQALIKTVTNTQLSLANLGLQNSAQYLWKVVARANDGRSSESETTWSFTNTQYPAGIASVWTLPEVISPEKNLPGLFDGLTYPNYAIRNFTIGQDVVIFMEFAKPTTLTGFNAGFGGDANRADSYTVSVQAADTRDSITSATPTQNILSNIPAPGKIIDINLQFGSPRTAKFFKVTVRRNDGDRRVHIYEMRPLLGSAGGGSIGGRVLANGNPVNGSLVQVCTTQGNCAITTTGATGRYSTASLAAGSYTVTAFPPAQSTLSKATVGPITLTSGQSQTAPDLILGATSAPPPGTTITNRGTGPNGAPIIYWNETLTLTTQGCANGSASYTIQQNGIVVRSGTMNEITPPGTYQAQIAPLYPLHDIAQVEINITCPDGSSETILFNIYIDPSGWVRNVDGSVIAGATVTLYRADLSSGPFQLVADGSAIMSPMNRRNPDLTDAEGHFGWDVIAGYYKVRAEKEGCVSAADAGMDYAESAVLTIPPAVFDLDLRLNCPLAPTPTEPPTPTETETPTATTTLTETPTLTLTPTQTVGASPTPSATATLTPTQTVGTSATRTATATRTPTITPTPQKYPSTIAGLKALLRDLKQQGAINDKFYRSASVLVTLADELLQHRYKQAAVTVLQAFVHIVEEHPRSGVTANAAQQIIDLTRSVIYSVR